MNQMKEKEMVKINKNHCFAYIATMLMVGIGLGLIYYKMNILYPLQYTGGDDMGVFYFIKTIKRYGWNIVNPMIGGSNGTTMYDYLYSDRWSFGLVWVISRFTDNIFLIGNLFYFLNFFLAAVISLYALTHMGYAYSISVATSVLYAFCPFLLQRYVHMWLTPYYFLPLVILSCVWIIEGDLCKAEGSWWKNKRIWQVVLFSLLCSQTGLYYAFFACVMYAITTVIILFCDTQKKVLCRFYPILYCIPVLCGISINAIPNLIYWSQHGYNSQNEMALRTFGDAELYGLKFIQLLLPSASHRIGRLASITQEYNRVAPLVNENGTATLGFIATIGLLVSIIWIFTNRKISQRQFTISRLNIGAFLVGTIGGIGALFSIIIRNPMRCYNRISVVIMFISLMAVASCLQFLSDRISKWSLCCLLLVMIIVGVYDQTNTYLPWDYQMLDDVKDYFQEIEEICEPDSAVFQIPYVAWPSGGNYRMFSGYLFTETLHWSFGSMQGREEAEWQQKVIAETTQDMLQDIEKAGYQGVYLDAVPYIQQYGEEALQTKISEINQILGTVPLQDKTEELYYWNIK